MSVYAIGDVQGCYQELQELLYKINFDDKNDQLWFTGDLVNRGPDSLSVLRLVKGLGAITVLGNHDLHLLALAAGASRQKQGDTLNDVLNADDRDELFEWLRHMPLLHSDDRSGFTLIHAGLPPQWDLQQATELAREAEAALQADTANDLFTRMYGNQPDTWDEKLKGWDRLRFIVNACTRTRFCTSDGQMDFKTKGPPGTEPESMQPWFSVPLRKTRRDRIIFGHWASLHSGNIRDFELYNIYPLDTGCVWGGRLTAMRLDDKDYFTVPSRQKPAGRISD